MKNEYTDWRALVQDLQKEAKNNTTAAEALKVVNHNLSAGIKEAKINIFSEGGLKNPQQLQNTRAIIEAAPELQDIFNEWQQELPQGWGLVYSYDSEDNRIHVSAELLGSGQRTKPIVVELEDLLGNIRKGQASGAQIMVAGYNSAGAPMITTPGIKALQNITQKLKSERSRYYSYLKSAAAIRNALPQSPEGEQSIKVLTRLASRSAGSEIRRAQEAVQTDKTFIGSSMNVYRSQNPEIRKMVQQTISYQGLIDDFLKLANVRDEIRKAGASFLDISNKLKINTISGANIGHEIPEAIRKLQSFKQLAEGLKAIQSMGISVNQLNDESFSAGRVLGNIAPGGKAWGTGRLFSQLANYAPLSQEAIKARRDSGPKHSRARQKGADIEAIQGKRFLVRHGTPAALRARGYGVDATGEGGIFLRESTAKQLGYIETRSKKFSAEEIEQARQKAIEKNKRALKAYYDTYGGGTISVFPSKGKKYDFDTSTIVGAQGLADYYESIGQERQAKRARYLVSRLQRQEQLNDAENWGEEYIYSKIVGEKLNPARTAAGRVGFDYEKINNGEAVRGVVEIAKKISEGSKILGGRGSGRNSVVGINQNYPDFAAVADSTSIKSRKVSDVVFAPLEDVMEFVQDNLTDTQRKNALSSYFKTGKYGSFLDSYFTFDEKLGRYVADQAKFQAHSGDSKELEAYATNALAFLQNVNEFVDAVASKVRGRKSKNLKTLLSDQEWKELAGDITVHDVIDEKTGQKTGEKEYERGASWLAYTYLNPAAMFSYGMPKDTEVSFNEVAQRTVENAIALTGDRALQNNSVLKQLYQPSAQQKALQERQVKSAKTFFSDLVGTKSKFAPGKSTLGNFDAQGGYMTVGYGPGYTIDISQGKDFGTEDSDLQYDVAGNITQESYENSIRYFVESKARQLISDVTGIAVEDLTDAVLQRYKIYVDTSAGAGGGFATRQYVGAETANNQVAVLEANAVPLSWGSLSGNKLTQIQKSEQSLLQMVAGAGALEKTRNIDETAADLGQQKVTDATMSLFTSYVNPIAHSKNAEYQASHNAVIDKGVEWGTNLPSQTFDEDVATAYMSEEAFREMLDERFNKKGAFGDFQKFIDIVTGGSVATDFKDFNEGFERLANWVAEDKSHSIFGGALRYPASTGQDFRFLNWRFQRGTKGTGVRLSRGMSALINGDFDGDRIASLVLGLQDGTSWEDLKQLYEPEKREKLLNVSRYAAQELQRQIEADEAKGGGSTLKSSVFKEWSDVARNDVTERLRSVLKAQTGRLSNYYQGWEQWTAKQGLNEKAMYSSDPTERMDAMRAFVGRMMLSEITQEAISAKKIAEVFEGITSADWEKMSEEERGNKISTAISAAQANVDQLLSLTQDPLLYTKGGQGDEARKNFQEALKKMGVVDDEGHLGARAQSLMMGTLYQFAGQGKDRVAFFKELFGLDSLTEDQLDQFDAKGNLVKVSTAADRLAPTVDKLVYAFSSLGERRGLSPQAIVDVLQQGKEKSREISTEQVLNFLHHSGIMPSAVNNAVRYVDVPGKKGAGGTGDYIQAEAVYIEAANVVINAQNVSGGGDGINTAALGLFAPGSGQIEAKDNLPWRVPMSVTDRVHQLSPSSYGTLYERFYTDLAEMYRQGKTGLDATNALKETEYYQTDEGKNLMAGAIESALSTALGTYGHSLMEQRIYDVQGKQWTEKTPLEVFRERMGDLVDVDSAEIKERLATIEQQAQALGDFLDKRYGLKNLSSESNIGFYNTQTGERLKGRIDYAVAQDYTDDFKNTQRRYVIGDYKFLHSDKISPDYFAQLAYYQLGTKQLLENWDKLGLGSLGEDATFEDYESKAAELNRIITTDKPEDDEIRKILGKLGYTKGRGTPGKRGYAPERLIDPKMLAELGSFFNFYGGKITPTLLKNIVSEIDAVNKNTGKQNVRSKWSVFTAPPEVQSAIASQNFMSADVTRWINGVLNPREYYTAAGKKIGEADIANAAAGGSVTTFNSQGTLTSLSKINQLLTQRLQIEREIAQVNAEIEQATARQAAGDTSLASTIEQLQENRSELEGLKEDVQTAIETEGNTLTASAQQAYQANEMVKTGINQRRIRISQQGWSDNEASRLAKEYEQNLNKRLQVESKIDQMMQQRNTTIWRPEMNALDEAIRLQTKKLDALKQEGAQLLANKNIRESDVRAAEGEYNLERSAQKATNATRNHGIANVWDMMGYDIKRSMMMVFDFGVAHKAINSIQTKIRELITTIQELDQAMTNIRIVTGYSQEKATDLMKTYNDLASQLGTTTQAVAESANEWLKKLAWVTINPFNCWNTLRAA